MRPISASDLMNPEVLTVPEDMPVPELAAFLIDQKITGAPVEDAGGNLVGVVSVVDIAALVADELEDEEDDDPADAAEEEARDGAEGEDEDRGEDEDLVAADLMTPEVVSVDENATVAEVASLMLECHLHRLVVTRGGEVVGIISTSDLLGLFLEDE